MISRSTAPWLGLVAVLLVGMAPDGPPVPKEADQKFEKLWAEAQKDPEKADWKALRRAFAETSFYHPYDILVVQELRRISQAIGRGQYDSSEVALLKLLERERSMRLDTLTLLATLAEKTKQPEKAAKYRKLVDANLKLLLDPRAGGSFKEPIEVLYIEEEYRVLAKLTARRQGLVENEGRMFDVFEIEGEGEKPGREIYFNVDLPQNNLKKMMGTGIDKL